MPNFLLEIGTEELPADFARLALPQLEESVRSDLAQVRLSHGLISCNSTPRRIALLVENLAKFAEDIFEERKGPPAEQAFCNDAPTSAAIGFAKRIGVDLKDLEVKETEKGPFVFANTTCIGAPTIEILENLIPSWINSLQGRRFMRWGQGERRFSRPIRWLLALLDEELVPVSLCDTDPKISSGKESRGHRLHNNVISIFSTKDYKEALWSSGVIVNRDERTSFITGLVYPAAKSLNAEPDLPESLLNELIDLVEFPVLIEGSIPEKYLGLPPEVLSTVMRVHQRYIPLYLSNCPKDPLVENSRGVLLSRFLCIGNGLAASVDKVRLGNERVLKARLEDAEFFVSADRSISSEERVGKLSSVTFAEGLGSLLDRVGRMQWLMDPLIKELELDQSSSSNLRRATYLCKHDLVSHMVGEFPELQGIIGGKYLLSEGEERAVALAVSEHYFPRGSGDLLPQSHIGAVLAIIDRLELLISIFAKGGRPTGSSDPYGLRRAGNGILQILWSRGWKLNLDSLLRQSIEHWKDLLPIFEINHLELYEEISGFFCQRIVSLLEDSDFDYDLVQAVAGESTSSLRLLSDPNDARNRIELLLKMRINGTLSTLQAVVTRASGLADKGDLDSTTLNPLSAVDPKLFEKESEIRMLNVLLDLEPLATNKTGACYLELAEGLSSGANVLSSFFDGKDSVMVMSDNEIVRKNRLNLLGVLRNQASVLADFSKLSI
ncbi:glycine--tRNA ligase subunit beta [Prochlorococcus sp. MIT 1341]|uniref:glycine--tRNA ligase subunit beta n=1 Tax=Prochlorococcus sp. MIT 1341 TaxID=3096221 RepID=UPI002A7635E8|nr:glycine--tRNA ligase subunit beta [Prochlorococcus sp. MIT 1341]